MEHPLPFDRLFLYGYGDDRRGRIPSRAAIEYFRSRGRPDASMPTTGAGLLPCTSRLLAGPTLYRLPTVFIIHNAITRAISGARR